MKLNDESKVFHLAVYSAVAKIPYGKVTSYGHIALLINRPQNSRLVGSSLKHLLFIARELNRELGVDGTDDKIDIENLPWWRVVLSAGKISPRDNPTSELRQMKFLRDEGIAILEGRKVDMDIYGWFPDEIDL